MSWYWPLWACWYCCCGLPPANIFCRTSIHYPPSSTPSLPPAHAGHTPGGPLPDGRTRRATNGGTRSPASYMYAELPRGVGARSEERGTTHRLSLLAPRYG